MTDTIHVFEETSQLQAIRAQLHKALGRETILQAHRQHLWLDAVVLAVLMLGYYGGFIALGLVDIPSAWLAAMVVLQGIFIVQMAMLSHDLFEHRQAWKGWRQEWLSALLFLPATTPSSVHRIGHLRHHAKIGTYEDTEASLASVSTVWRRLLFCTAVGYLIARTGKWGRHGLGGYEAFLGASPRDHKLKKREALLLLAWLVLNIALLFTPYWKAAAFGFFLPIVVVATTLSSIRVVLEHASLDPANPWSLATYYRSGPIVKALFMVNAGDCHLVHHIFPRVPWYNMSALVKEVGPILTLQRVAASDSFWRLLYDWFVKNRHHRSDWQAFDRAALSPAHPDKHI
jgi:fatty acid desaturase